MRGWLLTVLFIGASLSLPSAQACTSEPPPPLPDFHFLEWQDADTVITVLGGSEAFFHVPSGSWASGEPRTHRDGCDPGPPRPGVLDEVGQWALQYGDFYRCCMGTMTRGPLELVQDNVTVHSWSEDASWLRLEDGVAVFDDEDLQWLAWGETVVRERSHLKPDPAGLVGPFRGNEVLFLRFDQPMHVVDVEAATTSEVALPEALQGPFYTQFKHWMAPEGGVVVGANGHITWFNGSFTPPVEAVPERTFVVRGGVLSNGPEGAARHPRGGVSVAWDVDVMAAATGPEMSAAAVRAGQSLQLVILDGDLQVLSSSPVPGDSTATPTAAPANETHEGPASQASPASILWLLALAGLAIRRRW